MNGDGDYTADLKTLAVRAAERWGDRAGLVFDQQGERLTFEEIDSRSNSLARALQGIGVEQGDRVAVMLRNRPEFPLAWLALAKVGAAMVPLNVYHKELEARNVLGHSGARLAIISPEFETLINSIRDDLPELDQVLCVDEPEGADALDLGDLWSAASTDPVTTGIFPETTANVQYTSGTTGFPKGCILSHGYWTTSAAKHIRDTSPPLDEEDVMLTAQPFYYLDPQWNLATSLASGARLVVLDRFHPSTFWQKVREHGVTFFYCLGLMPTLLLKMPPSPRDRHNRVRHVSCSAIPVHLHRELERRWGAPWHESFGTTETGSDISVRPGEHDELVGSGCIGRPKEGREARVVGEDGSAVPRGEDGELVLRGAGMMDGYFKDPEATNEVFRDGWFHTGDLARMDEDGRIFYVGRKKEMIRRSGENISATEVEEAIKMHPDVHLAACIPVPDDLREEEVKVYVVLKPGESKETVTPRKLADFCSERLAYFKVPRYWEYRDDLPRTPSERVAKHVLLGEEPDPRSGSYDTAEDIWR